MHVASNGNTLMLQPNHKRVFMPCFSCMCVLCVCLSPVIYCFVYYLWVGHNYCYAHLAGFTALFLLPGEKISITTSRQSDTCIDILMYVHFNRTVFLRLGPPVAQLSVVPLRWTHPQEVSHLDTHTAPGHF